MKKFILMLSLVALAFGAQAQDKQDKKQQDKQKATIERRATKDADEIKANVQGITDAQYKDILAVRVERQTKYMEIDNDAKMTDAEKDAAKKAASSEYNKKTEAFMTPAQVKEYRAWRKASSDAKKAAGN